MGKLLVDYKGLDSSEQKLLKTGLNYFNSGDFSKANDIFIEIHNRGTSVKNLQLLIGLCYTNMNQNRLARLYLYNELLLDPSNTVAFKELVKENIKINGKTINANFHHKTKPDKVPSISLVLIVKNEEANLQKCLNSYKDIVQEIIVVDTGSTDKTVEIAKSFGARVVYFAWTNDFSEARNESLKYATCDWILRTDADEYIEDDEKPKLLHAVTCGLADIYVCPTVSSDDGHHVADNQRLIKNHLGLKYDFPIHETLTPSANKLGITQCITNIQFKHTGYDNLDKNEWDSKVTRNIKICDDYLALHQNDYYVKLIKGVSLLHFNNIKGAISEFEETLNTLPDDALGMRYLGLAYYYLLNYYKEKDDLLKLKKVLIDSQIDFYGISSMMQFVAEFYLYEFADFQKAERLFNWVSNRNDESKIFFDVLPPNNYSKENSLFHLMEVYAVQKEYSQAKKARYKWLQEKKLGVKEKQTNTKNSEDTIGEELLRRSESGDSLRELAKKYKNKKMWQSSYETIISSVAVSKICLQDYYDLAVCQIELGKTKFARFLVNEAKMINSDSAEAYNIESIIAVAEKNNDEALEKIIKAFITEPQNSIYQSNVENIAKLMNLTPVEALKKIGKGWIERGQQKEGLFALATYLKFQPEDEEVFNLIYSNIKD